MARVRPHALDDVTLDRVDEQYRERQEYLELFTKRLRRWLALDLTEGQCKGIGALIRRVKAA